MKTKTKINTVAILRVYWQHVRPYKWLTLLILFMMGVGQAASVIVPIYYKRVFDLLSGDLSSGSLDIFDVLFTTLVFIALLNGIIWIGWHGAMFLNSWLQPRVMADLEQGSLRYLHEHSYRFFSNNFAGSLVRKVSRLARSFEDIADQIEFNFLPLIITLVGNLYVLWTRSVLLALILLGWTFLFLAFNAAFAIWKLKFDFRRSEIDSEATGVLADSITNAITVKSFTGQFFEQGLFREITERLRRANTFTWNLNELMEAIQMALMFAIEFVMMYVAIRLWRDGLLTIGDFALLQGYLLGTFDRVWNFGRAIRKTFSALADADEMVQILEEPHEVIDVDCAQPLVVTDGAIEFQGVCFNFNQTRRVLHNMSMVIKPKEKVALVGPSGAGKSTVTKLLLRFFDLERGKIFIDGQQIARVTQESLREAVSLVPQDPILFHRSIMENIRYGRRGATDEEVIEAAKKARAHEFIKDLPQGYDTFVGERGVKLSGGERQRVAIARAILKNAPILILDEATSSLDSESEQMIQEALAMLMQDKTTIVIAHRLSTIMKMDRIIVIAKGKVVDSGTHKQLIAKKDGIYKKLWEIQAGGFIK
jgi:ATP-binding cassette subfamily B protein